MWQERSSVSPVIRCAMTGDPWQQELSVWWSALAVAVHAADIKHFKTPESFSARNSVPAICACQIKHNTGQITLLKLKNDWWRCVHTSILLFFLVFNYLCEQGDLPQLPLRVSPICGLHPGVFHLLTCELKILSVNTVSVLNCVIKCLSVHCQTLTCTITQVQANMQHSDLDN